MTSSLTASLRRSPTVLPALGALAVFVLLDRKSVV
jgi:hypothetical protein